MLGSWTVKWAVLAASIGAVGCVANQADPERTGQTAEALTICKGSTLVTIGGGEVIPCQQLGDVQLMSLCTWQNGCAIDPTDPTSNTCTTADGSDGPGSVTITFPITETVSCLYFPLSECASHAGCSVYKSGGDTTPVCPSGNLSGFFFNNGTGYYAKPSGHYCAIDSWAQWVASGAPLAALSADNRSGYPVCGIIPSTMTYDGDCQLPAGFFFNNGTGYKATSAGHYCAFTSWDLWLAAGGPRSGAPTFPTIPSSMSYDGICPQCAPGTTSCVGTTPRVCSAGGQWVSSQVVGGTCGAVCTPGASPPQCSGIVPQVCGSDGQWQYQAPCPVSCAGGVCLTPSGSCGRDSVHNCVRGIGGTCCGLDHSLYLCTENGWSSRAPC